MNVGPRYAKWILWGSRWSFSLSVLLAMMTPAWEAGTFTHFPLATIRLSGQRFSVGVLALVPALSIAACLAARVAAGEGESGSGRC